jgi:hypothetical protein
MKILRGRSGRGGPGGNKGENDEQQTRYLSVESAAEMIDSLPSDVPRESQLRIVREAFGAAGIDVSNLERHTRTRGAQLGSEIELVRNRQKELREKTEEIVRALEEEIRTVQEEIRKVQEAFDAGLAEEEEKLSTPLAALKDVRRVRAFFAFPETDDDVPETTYGEGNPNTRVRRIHAEESRVEGEGFREARA